VLRHASISHRTLGAGVTERARQGTADLARNAQRAAVKFGDEHGFGLVAVGEFEQPLPRRVARRLLAAELRTPDDKMLPDECSVSAWQVEQVA